MSESDLAKKMEVLRSNRDFRALPEEKIQELAALAIRIPFKKGEFIFHAGDPSDYCHVVESGFILLSKESSTGKSIAFSLLEKGYTLNAVTCFKPCPRYFSARAVKNASVLAIPGKEFKEWVLKNPEVTEIIICTLGELLDAAYHRFMDFVNENAEQRVINTLCMISSRMGPSLPLTNKDLADLIGTAGETVARAIVKLQKSGLLSKSRGQITIANVAQLKLLSTRPTIFI